jgi:conjugal transfer ATP-binding protein TraC
MHRQALLASLPMTLSEKFHKDLAKMRRVSRKTMANAIHLAPLIAEWRGTRTPALVFGGRRGQLMTLDIFDNDLGNYNFAIIGAPGLGQVGADERDGLVLPRHRRQGLDAGPRPLLREAVPQGQGHLHRVQARCGHLPEPVHAHRRHQRRHRHAGAGHLEDGSMSRPLDEVQYKAISAMVLKLFRERTATT